MSLVLSAGLLIGLLSFGNVSAIVAEISRFQVVDLFWYVALFATYELGRWLLWHFLLSALDVRVRTRHQLVSFLMGEVSKNLPFGNYFPNYVMQRAEGADFGRTSAVTTAIVLCEVTVSLLGIVILGVGSWSGWLRPMILVGAPTFMLGAWIVYRWRAPAGAPQWMASHKIARGLLTEWRQFRDGARRLWRPRTIAVGLVICAGYISTVATALYVITRGLHVETLAWPQVVAVSCFSLAFALIEPSPIDLGVTEAGGVGAFLAVGLAKDPAITAMLINRVLGVVTSLIIVGIGLIVLRHEVHTILSKGSTERVGQPEHAPPSHPLLTSHEAAHSSPQHASTS
jgi:uncharacterized membrane protein YbhN (UPF0104 family)